MLVAGSIEPSTEKVPVGMTVWMTACRSEMMEVVTPMISLESATLVLLYVAGIWTRFVLNDNVLFVVCVDMTVGFGGNMPMLTLNGIVLDISVLSDAEANMGTVIMPVPESGTLPISLEELSFAGLIPYRCWSLSAALGCRALQAWTPSCHVC